MNISKEEYETLVSTKMLLIQANETIQEQRRIIERLITVEERPHGMWIPEYPINYKCSICNVDALDVNDYPYKSNFCPNCGADMRGEDNG